MHFSPFHANATYYLPPTVIEAPYALIRGEYSGFQVAFILHQDGDDIYVAVPKIGHYKSFNRRTIQNDAIIQRWHEPPTNVALTAARRKSEQTTIWAVGEEERMRYRAERANIPRRTPDEEAIAAYRAKVKAARDAALYDV